MEQGKKTNILMSINIYHVYLTDFKVKQIKSKINKYNNNNTNTKHEI
jgi:hypothetical protein